MMDKEELKNCLEYLDGVGMIQTASCYTCKQLVQQFIHYSACKDKTPKVITNEKAKEVCCSTCRHARGYSCTNSQTCKGDYEFWEQ